MAMKTPTIDQPFYGYSWPVRLRSVHAIYEASEYRRQKYLCLACTILGQARSSAEQKRIVEQWCRFFSSPTPILELALRRRVPQQLFDAVCEQEQLLRLHVKWGPVVDLAALRKTPLLEGLSLGTTSVEDLSPLIALKKLTHLQLDNLKRVYDFSDVGKCRKLEFLQIEGYPQGPQKITMKDLHFLSGLKNLKALDIGFVKVEEFDIEPILGLKRVEYLSLPEFGRIEQKRLDKFSRLICDTLPRLKHGSVVSHASANTR